MSWEKFYTRFKKDKIAPERLIAIDPGNETGMALFTNGIFEKGWQVSSAPGGVTNWREVEQMVLEYNPTIVVCENYRVYAHKLEQHSYSDVNTLRIIGCIEYLCWKHNIPLEFQMAAQHKGFCTDVKLKQWDLWHKGMRHSRDATRAGCFFLLFGRY